MYYIGLAVRGAVNNVVTFRPRKKQVLVGFRIAPGSEAVDRLTEAGLIVLEYSARRRELSVRVDRTEFEQNREALRDLVHEAFEGSNR